jgi:hypothetical protein
MSMHIRCTSMGKTMGMDDWNHILMF